MHAAVIALASEQSAIVMRSVSQSLSLIPETGIWRDLAAQISRAPRLRCFWCFWRGGEWKVAEGISCQELFTLKQSLSSAAFQLSFKISSGGFLLWQLFVSVLGWSSRSFIFLCCLCQCAFDGLFRHCWAHHLCLFLSFFLCYLTRMNFRFLPSGIYFSLSPCFS